MFFTLSLLYLCISLCLLPLSTTQPFGVCNLSYIQLSLPWGLSTCLQFNLSCGFSHYFTNIFFFLGTLILRPELNFSPTVVFILSPQVCPIARHLSRLLAWCRPFLACTIRRVSRLHQTPTFEQELITNIFFQEVSARKQSVLHLRTQSYYHFKLFLSLFPKRSVCAGKRTAKRQRPPYAS